jgi:hypothetical protein
VLEYGKIGLIHERKNAANPYVHYANWVLDIHCWVIYQEQSQKEDELVMLRNGYG